MSEKLLKSTLKHLLLALDFLHTEAGVIHTGNVFENIFPPNQNMRNNGGAMASSDC